jgi:hypothetical protein
MIRIARDSRQASKSLSVRCDIPVDLVALEQRLGRSRIGKSPEPEPFLTR